MILQRLTLLVVHDQISSAVRFHVTQHPHDVGIVKLGEDSGLIEKSLQSVFEETLGVRSPRADGSTILAPQRQGAGKVLLNGDCSIEGCVISLIGDTKTANPDHPFDLEHVDQRAGWERLVTGKSSGSHALCDNGWIIPLTMTKVADAVNAPAPPCRRKSV